MRNHHDASVLQCYVGINLSDQDFIEKIHDANVRLHRLEAKYYDLLHDEIYSACEQKRLNSLLKKIDELIVGNQKEALDFGAGTGNITGKLLRMGYRVTALDISPEMCDILKKEFSNYIENKKLRIINLPIENFSFNERKFDLITSYSVLHHLPDYVGVVQKLSASLRKGGILYLDHEPSFFLDKPNTIQRLAKFIHFRANSLLNYSYLKAGRIASSSLGNRDCTLSDYWIFDEHRLDHRKIGKVLEAEKFDFFVRIDYHLNRSWVFSPTFYIYKHFGRPNMSLWIAKK